MLIIDLSAVKWSVNEVEVLKRIFKSDLTLRQSRPPIDYDRVTMDGIQYQVPKKFDGLAAYVWRMLVFTISTRSQHQCLPVMADYYLPVYPGISESMRGAIRAFGDEMVDKLLALIPATEWHGIARWASVLGPSD